MHPDNEINALNNVYETLKALDNTQIKRILVWVEKVIFAWHLKNRT